MTTFISIGSNLHNNMLAKLFSFINSLILVLTIPNAKAQRIFKLLKLYLFINSKYISANKDHGSNR